MDFNIAFDRGIGHEQGYVNNPNDPGGETNWGISKRSYPNVDIKNLSKEGAKEIYKRDFWDLINAEKLHDGVAWQLFDFAINSGIQTAVRYYQRALGVADDGHWGPVSQAASEKMSETDQIMLVIAERMEFQTKLKNWPDASRGWTRRNASNLRFGAQDS